MKLRVLHLASGDAWGGAEKVLSLLVEGTLAEGTADVEALLLNEGQLADTLRGLGASVHVIPESNCSLAHLVLTVRRWIARRGTAVIHAHRYKELLIAVLAMTPGKQKLVATIHGLEPWTQMKWKPAVVIWAVILLARFGGAQFVGVSDEITRRLKRLLGTAHVVQIGNPMPEPTNVGKVPTFREQFGWAPDRQVVGFVGRLEPVKGPDLFVEIASLGENGPGFVVIGSGSMEAELHTRVDREGLSDRVRFVGQVPDASACLRGLDALALTSRHEGLPMILLEAASCELPVVAFDVGGVRQVLDGGPAARLIPPGDFVSFRCALDELLVDRAPADTEAARWAASVRARFSRSKVVASYLDLYRGPSPRTPRGRP